MKLFRAKQSSLIGLGLLLALLGVGLPAAAGNGSVEMQVISYADAVRFVAQGEEIVRLRVQIYDLAGHELLDSGFVPGAALEWRLADAQGSPVANGVYLFVATVADGQGQQTRRVGKLVVLRGMTAWGVAPPLTAPTVGQLAGIQPLAIPPGVAWRQRLGQDREDNYRVQRRPGSRLPYQTLLLLEADGKLRVSELCLGATNGVGGDCRSVWPGGGGAVGWALTGNAGTDPATNFLGTTDNTALEIRVNNARALRLEPNDTSPNVIGGFSGNSVTSGVVGATIGGGGESGYTNRVTDDYGTIGGGGYNRAGSDDADTTNASYATVGGGWANTASGVYATVGGGYGNTASGVYATVGGGEGNTASYFEATVGGGEGNTASGVYATVGGGYGNTASGDLATVGGGRDNTASGEVATVGGGVDNTASGEVATVGGGRWNTASGFYATVGGGVDNTASGWAATVGGGEGNTAAGDYSFVVGLRAKNTDPNHDGVFLFADFNDFDFPSTAANQFRVRATGGAQFVLGIDGSGNPTWTCSVSNGTSWSCSSDLNLKENLTLVEGRQVLAQLSVLPIYTWSAKGGDPAVRHMGPMAQDFYSIFRLGTDDKMISTIDLDGVALVSIQALYQMSLEKDKQIEQLTQEIEDLRASNAVLQERVEQLEKLVKELMQRK
jgi:hypothetical protein